MAGRYQQLLQARTTLTAEREALDAELASATDETPEQQAASEARVEDLLGRIRANARAVSNEESLRDAIRNSAPAEAGGSRIESIRDLELDKPWGYQWKQAGAPAKIAQHAGFGELMVAARRAALGQGTDSRLLEMVAAAQGAGETVDADGGYLVTKDVATDIQITATGGEVLSRVDKKPVSGNGLTLKVINETDRATGSRSGAVRGYWIDEGAAFTASRPKFREITLKLRKLGALGYASDELLEDFPAFGAIMTEAFGEELKFLAEDSVFNGNGATQPLGFVGHPATVSVSKETGQAAATIVYENILNMWGRLWAPARAGAVWFVNQNAEAALNSMTLAVGVGGVPVYLPPGGLSQSPYSTLMGRPVIPVEYAAGLGTVGDITLANLKYYQWISKGGVRQDSSMHVAFLTDEMAFRAVMRVDGQPKWALPLTPFKGTGSTLSPIVTLATRA